MKHSAEVKVTCELLSDTNVTEEYILRKLAMDMVNKIDFNELSKIIKFNKVDPFSIESKQKINDINTPYSEVQYLLHLQNSRMVVFSAEVFS